MREITVEEYLKALEQLTSKQIEILQKLYESPKTAKELANEMNYSGFQASNSQIGQIGKKIANYIGLKPNMYFDGHKDSYAYFSIVGPYTKKGWEMTDNLRKAYENYNNRENQDSSENTLDDYIDINIDPKDLLLVLNDRMKIIQPTKVNKLMETTLRNDSEIVRLLKKLNNYTCQFPGCGIKIPKKNGGFYIEVAHIKPVAKGGQSVIGNLLVLCPNHHKAFDFGDIEISIQTPNELKGFLNKEPFYIKNK